MSSVTGEKTPFGYAQRPARLTDSERALLLATVAWGDQGREADETVGANEALPDFVNRLRERLESAWFDKIRVALEDAVSKASAGQRKSAVDQLGRMHREAASADLARVHPSWLVRALREESPAVQRFVAASLEGSLRHQLQAGLLLDSRDLMSERAAAPEVAQWVMALWSERLVGGDATRPDESAVLIVLGGLSPRAGYRLCRMAGFCKLILAGEPPDGRGDARESVRRDWLAIRLAHAEPALRELARADVDASRSSRLAPRRHAARIGLSTIARLLGDEEPFRVRWALQHWPYPIAKAIRALMPLHANGADLAPEGEALILKTAWDRLNLEGRLAMACPVSNFSKPGDRGAGAPALPASAREVSFF